MTRALSMAEMAKTFGVSEAQFSVMWYGLRDEQREAFAWRLAWCAVRKSHQIEPPGAWHIWALICGRGAGKTRTGAEWTGWNAQQRAGTRWLVGAPTAADLRDVCFEGDSGLLNVIPKSLHENYARSLNELLLKNGSIIKGIPASEPERFRGPQWHGGWLDEIAAWDSGSGNDLEAWDMIAMSMRLGDNPQLIITTTPKPRRIVKNIIARKGKDAVISVASTYVNLDNLAPTFRAQILQYEGTKIGKQEIHAEILDPESDGIIERRDWKMWPAKKVLPKFEIVVMSLDTAFTEDQRDKQGEVDPTACGVWGGFLQANGKPGVMLLDAWDDKLGFPDLLIRTKRELLARYGDDADTPLIKPMFGPGRMQSSGKGIDLTIIEDKGSGISLRQSLAAEGIATHPYNPGRADKLARLHIVSPLFTQGFVWAVESDKRAGEFKTWAEPLISQVCSYCGEGSTEHDDYVDVTTQALRVLNDMWLRQAMLPKIPGKAQREAQPVVPRGRSNPYAA